jgi:hypothetical protein
MAESERVPAERRRGLAAVGITIQFLALVRNLAEVYRLKYRHGAGVSLSVVEPYVNGALITALFCWLAVTLFFFRRYTLALVVAISTVALLLVYKVLLLT